VVDERKKRVPRVSSAKYVPNFRIIGQTVERRMRFYYPSVFLGLKLRKAPRVL